MDAEEFVKYRINTREGPFYCGDSEEKGRTITVDQVAHQDNVKRFSDKWITQRQIGNTVNTYPYFSTLIGAQLSSFVGLKVKQPEATQSKAAVVLQRLEEVVNEETTEQAIEVEQDEEEAELPDEFEEFEDDDYNAEKYFDDGDGDGDIDDNGEPDYS